MEPAGPIWCWVTANSAVLRDLGSIFLAMLGIGLLTWRSLSAERQARASQTQADLAQKQISLARHDSLIDRYQKASDMLGSNLLSVRLGGIYGLCQLAQDYPREFHLQVVNLLAAFVRHPPEIPFGQFGVTEDGHPRIPIPREETQTILEFLGRRTAEGRKIEKEEDYTINLDGSVLWGVRLLPGANFEGISLKGSDLTAALFIEVNGLTQNQICGALHDPHNRAIFRNTEDEETGEPLTLLEKT